MYKGIPFRMQPLEDIEADAAEIASEMPEARTIQLLSANPLVMSFENLMPRLQLIKKHLPKLEHMYTATRVSDLKDKTVEQLKALRDIGLNEISLGVESGDDWTLQRIDKGYTSADILEQCHKLEEAGIAYWVTFLNGVAGREHKPGPCDQFSQNLQSIEADARRHGRFDTFSGHAAAGGSTAWGVHPSHGEGADGRAQTFCGNPGMRLHIQYAPYLFHEPQRAFPASQAGNHRRLAIRN